MLDHSVKHRESSNGEIGPRRAAPKIQTAEARQSNPVWNRIATRIQAKLTVSTPGDPEEREADRIADRIMRTPERLQRKCAACEEEDVTRLQRKDNGNTNESSSSVPPAVHEALSQTGRPLDQTTKEFFEARFGHDFSSVRV